MIQNTGVAWGNIPDELKERPQWVVSGANKAPLSMINGKIIGAKSTDPATWMTFNDACWFAWNNRDLITTHVDKHGIEIKQQGYSIGYMLSADDPFTCIDLDVKDSTNCANASQWTTPDQYDRYWAMVQAFNSYTETSRSGKGLHIWVRGNIGVGCRRDHVEVYSQERYIICTGHRLEAKPIVEAQALLDNMVSQMRGTATAEKFTLVELEEDEPDEVVIDRAMSAGNGQKFNELCMGRWQQFGFPSQSEADLALMSMFTFYSKSNAQCKRLFRMTALGKREKAVKDDRYLNYTLRIIRGRQDREDKVDASALLEAAQLAQQTRLQEIEMGNGNTVRFSDGNNPMPTALHAIDGVGDYEMPKPASAVATLAGPVTAPAPEHEGGIAWPPGMCGAIASFIYNSSPRPVREIAIVAALGLLAGLCGKAYSIPQSGLNVYIILVARSAVGKEAMHSGISALCKAALTRCPSIMDFVDFNDYASGPALIKKIVASPSVVNVAGEWGRKLKAMSQDDRDTSGYSTLRTVMTNLYQKSGPQSIVGGITYSNKDNNIASVSGVAFSMIGETTPRTLFDSLTESMMEDGFLSRFTIVEYTGDRPPLNQNPILEPTKALGDAIGDLAQHVKHLIGIGQNVAVGRTAEAARLMFEYENLCDSKINSTTDEGIRQMWNRASLKVMRLSALLACADNWVQPVINEEQVLWAKALVDNDIKMMQARISMGDIGTGDATREKKIMAICADYLRNKNNCATNHILNNRLKKEMHEAGVVPRWYLNSKIQGVSAFTRHRAGSRVALDTALQSLVDSGYLRQYNDAKGGTTFKFNGKAYAILRLPEDV